MVYFTIITLIIADMTTQTNKRSKIPAHSFSRRWRSAICAFALVPFAPLASGQEFILDWNDPGWTNATTGNPSEFLTDPKDGAGWSDVHQLMLGELGSI